MEVDLNRASPVIDYTSMDAEAFLADVISYAQAEFSDTWTDFNEGQLGWVFVKVQAYQFDMGTFYLNALLNETVLGSALRRQSILDIAAMLDYTVPSAAPSTVTMRLTVDPLGVFPFDILANTHKVSNGSALDLITFMPISDTTVAAPPGPGYVDVLFIEGDLTTGEAVGSSTGAPNQRFVLANRPVLDGTLDVYVNGVLWALAEHAVDQTAAEESYLVEVDEADNLTIVFGDGVNGKVPTATFLITADYKVGGGRRGNIGTETIESIVSMPSQITAVTNPVTAATGGAEKPSNVAVKRAVPANLHVHSGLITDLDIQDGALLVPGVGKARAFPGDALTRTIDLVVAPAGGGVPSAVLKNLVQNTLRTNKLIGLRLAIKDPVYKQVDVRLLIHAYAGVRRDDLENLVRSTFTNNEGTGYLDFDQVGFAGLDEAGDPILGEHQVHDLLTSLASAKIRRAQIETLSINPGYRRLRPTTGNGTVTPITTYTNDNRRREYVIRFTSATTFDVKERIIGTIKQVEDSAIVDDTKDFVYEGFDAPLPGRGYSTLNPDRRQTTTFTVTSNLETRVAVSGSGLFLLCEPGSEYYIEKSLASGTTGVNYVVTDPDNGETLLDFTVNAGASPWAVSDELVVDVYPRIGDILLRNDELLQLDLVGSLSVRIAGGIS